MEQNRKVKFMKKKLSLLLCLIVAVLTLTACGTDPASVDYYGTSYDDIKYLAENYVLQLSSLSEEDIEGILAQSTDDAISNLLTGWRDATEDLGEYQGLGEFTINKTNGTVTAEQYAEFPEREVIVTYVFEYDYEAEQLVISDMTADKVYTLGEKMSKAGLNTLMGVGTVFAVLILISLIIYCFKLIPYLTERGKKKASAQTEAPAVPSVGTAAAAEDDLELIAVISAAIAASEGTSADSFVVRSIHRR